MPRALLYPAILLLATATLGCAPRGHGLHSPAGAAVATKPALPPPAAPGEPTEVPAPVEAGEAPPEVLEGPSFRLSLDATRLSVPAGRSLVRVDLEPRRYTSLLVLGGPDALLGFDVIGPPELRPLRAHRAQDEDGMLPRALSFRSPEGVDAIELVIDVKEPVEIARAGAPIPDAPVMAASSPVLLAHLRKKKGLPPIPLIGLPVPLSRDEGYTLLAPERYHFMRLDAAEFLLAAFKQTRRRFRRDPIGIADISQWDGLRPATDMGAPRHISHEGGRDVDLALPANDDEPSTVRAHCAGVLRRPDYYVCRPGTAKGVDSLRLAYFLGLLLDGPPQRMVERIFMDEVYIEQTRRAAEVLKERRWIKAAGLEGLFDDRLVRASPWHVDHVHVRFSGAPAVPPFWGSPAL